MTMMMIMTMMMTLIMTMMMTLMVMNHDGDDDVIMMMIMTIMSFLPPPLSFSYYIDTDTSIKQEGLTISCHSIMIVGLQFRFLRRIPELVLNEAEEPITLKPTQRTALFKFFIPKVSKGGG